MKNGHTTRKYEALLLVCTFGIAGVLLDLDHLFFVIFKGLPITQSNLIGHRMAHFPVLFLSGIVCVLVFSYMGGWIIANYRNAP